MGYESKIYVVQREKNEKNYYGQIIAMFDLCNMGYGNGWKELFKTEVKYDVFIENGNEETKKDCYGETLKEAPIEAVIEWLENYIARGETYRRLNPCLNMLKGFNLDEWGYGDGLYIIHYGY